MSVDPPEFQVNNEDLFSSKQAQVAGQKPLNPLNPEYSQDLYRIFTNEEVRQYVELLPQAFEREKRLQVEYPTKDKPSGWQTTDPQSHNPDNFRYIVHTIINTGDNDYLASLLGKPEKTYRMRKWMSLADFLSREMISCTLIDEVHRGTYDQRKAVFHGFILNVPEENIVAIAPGDMVKPWGESQHGAQIYSRQEREQYVSVKRGLDLKRNTTSAQQFFDNGVNPTYNEVVIDGIGPKGRQISIGGIFLIIDPVLGAPLYELYTRLRKSPKQLYGRLLAPVFKLRRYGEDRWDFMEMRRRYTEAKNLAQLLRVPIIHIPAPLPI